MIRYIYIVILIFVVSIGCTSRTINTDNTEVSICYVNLEFIVQYMYKKNSNMQKNIEDQGHIEQRIQEVTHEGHSGKRNKDEERVFNTLTTRLKELQQEESKFKKALYLDIDRVIKNIAVRQNFSLILNMQESIIYGRSDLDITEIVIAELEKYYRKYKPVSR